MAPRSREDPGHKVEANKVPMDIPQAPCRCKKVSYLSTNQKGMTLFLFNKLLDFLQRFVVDLICRIFLRDFLYRYIRTFIACIFRDVRIRIHERINPFRIYLNPYFLRNILGQEP